MVCRRGGCEVEVDDPIFLVGLCDVAVSDGDSLDAAEVSGVVAERAFVDEVVAAVVGEAEGVELVRVEGGKVCLGGTFGGSLGGCWLLVEEEIEEDVGVGLIESEGGDVAVLGFG